jgi:hypothetical protein
MTVKKISFSFQETEGAIGKSGANNILNCQILSSVTSGLFHHQHSSTVGF